MIAVGCATIVANGPDHVPINTTPEGAKVFLNGMPVGRTPMVITPRRSEDFNLRIELEGYEPIVVSRGKSFNGWFLGNILLGGVIGIVVDVATSNVMKHGEDVVYAELHSLNSDGSKSAKTERLPMTRVPASR